MACAMNSFFNIAKHGVYLSENLKLIIPPASGDNWFMIAIGILDASGKQFKPSVATKLPGNTCFDAGHDFLFREATEMAEFYIKWRPSGETSHAATKGILPVAPLAAFTVFLFTSPISIIHENNTG